ncbi:MAG: hypothetical protein ACREIA_24545 [Opitutaceae bacterium]
MIDGAMRRSLMDSMSFETSDGLSSKNRPKGARRVQQGLVRQLATGSKVGTLLLDWPNASGYFSKVEMRSDRIASPKSALRFA